MAAITRDYLVRSRAAPPEIADTLASGIVGLVDGAVQQWLQEPGAVDRARLTACVTAMVRGAAEAVVGPVAG